MKSSKRRARSRTKQLPLRQAPKRLLVLSSTEGLGVARAIKSVLENDSGARIEATVWDHVDPAEWLLKGILEMIQRFPFVVLVLTPDDIIVRRGSRGAAPRDNVILELGVALALNDAERTFVVHPSNMKLKLPSDIDGLVRHTYTGRTDGNLRDQVRSVCDKLMERILALDSIMSWDRFFSEITALSRHINEDRDRLQPHVVVGVNMGGLVVGGLLYFLNRQKWHFLTLWTRDDSRYRDLPARQSDFREELRKVLGKVRRNGEDPRILLVDDSSKSGESMREAVSLVRAIAGKKVEVRTAAIVHVGSPDARPTYCTSFDYQRFKYAPV